MPRYIRDAAETVDLIARLAERVDLSLPDA